MKREKIIVRGLMLLAVLLLTVGCSDDAVDSQRADTTVELFPYLSDYTDDETVVALTRGETPSWAPSGYYEFRTLNGVSGLMNSNEGASIGVFFTSDTRDPAQELHYFRPRGGGEDWYIYPKDLTIDAREYRLYGYVPYDAATSSITNYEGSYNKGAVLSLKDVNGVLSRDFCVIVGAKHGVIDPETQKPVPATTSKKVAVGDFACEIKNSNNNFIYLLFDHLCSALRFRFNVNSEYGQLRTIKLTKLELSAYSDAACTVSAKQLKATITLQQNESGTSPIVDGVTFTQDDDENSGSTHKVSIFSYTGNEGGVELPSVYDQFTDYLGFAPVTNATSYYMLYSKYDVYDKKGNLIRKDCVATNKIDVRKRFNLQTGMERGKIYTLRLTVEPTYLYVLSEPDLDNPTVTVTTN